MHGLLIQIPQTDPVFDPGTFLGEKRIGGLHLKTPGVTIESSLAQRKGNLL